MAGFRAQISPGMIDQRLKKILQSVLKTDNVGYEDGITTLGLWDSMAHMEIILAIEKDYSLTLEPGQIISLTSVKAIQDFLASKGVL